MAIHAHFVNTVFVHPIHTVQHVMISTCTSIRPQRLPPALSSITFHHHNVRFEPTFKIQFQFALHPSLWSEFKACRRVDPVAGDNRRAQARDQPEELYLLFKIFSGQNRQILGGNWTRIGQDMNTSGHEQKTLVEILIKTGRFGGSEN